jgi:hypothetical protein
MSRDSRSATSLKIFSDGRESYSVEANKKIRIVIDAGSHDIVKATLYLAERAIETFDDIPNGTQVINDYELEDLVGKNRISLKGEDGNDVCSPKNLVVSPKHLSMEDFEDIKYSRMPSLFEEVNAENVIDMIYRGGSKTMSVNIEEYSVGRLIHYYSEKLFDLTAKIVTRIDYTSENVRKNYKGMVKGRVNWVKTAIFRSNKGVAADIVFVCDQRKRTYNTVLNLIMTRFHYEVFKEARFLKGELERREHEKGIWKKIYGYQEEMYDKKAMDFLKLLKTILIQHRDFLVSPLIKSLIKESIRFNKDDEAVIRKGEMEVRKSKNQHYASLLEFWKEFVHSYSSIFETPVFVDTQRMSDVYKLWCVCEVAGALEMKSVGRTLREFKSSNKNASLYFEKLMTIKQGWISDRFDYDSISGPEILLLYGGHELFIEPNYGAGQEVSKEEVYRLMGYLHDYNISIGIMMYPGIEFDVIWDKRDGHIIVLMPFRSIHEDSGYNYESNAYYIKFIVDAVSRLKKALDMDYDLEKSIETAKKKVCDDFLELYKFG